MQIDDYVVYNLEGICKVSGIVYPDFAADKQRQYYLLIPIANESARVYVPVDMAEARCRKLITEEAAMELIRSVKSIEAEIVPNEKEREQIYKTALSAGDLRKVVSMIKDISSRRKARQLAGKKNTVVDEKYFKKADRLLCTELAFVLGKTDDEVRNMLLDCVK